MTKNTDYLLFNILDELCNDVEVDYKHKDIIGGKKYKTASIGYKYKLLYNGVDSILRYKYKDTEELFKISKSNCFFLLTLCRIYSRFKEKYKIVKVDNN